MASKRLAVITGASRGIGKAVAEQFLKADWAVINLSRSPCPVDGVTNLKTDLLNLTAVDAVDGQLLAAAKTASQICLIHNAAHYQGGNLADVDNETFQRSLQINITAPIWLTQALLPHMRETSSILYLGSTLSDKAVANVAPYVICKHAVVGMMRSTCQDLAGRGIHTCCICPGFTDTEMLQSHLENHPDLAKEIAALCTFNRLITPKEIAAVLFNSATQPVLNGAVIHANLGQIER